MEKRILGGSLEVSALGLGCMGLSHAYGEPVERKRLSGPSDMPRASATAFSILLRSMLEPLLTAG